jgi:hypothetical protein
MTEDSRGASSLNNAMRTRRVINTMSGAEADKAGIVGNARLSYFKADTAGSSMTKPAEALEWYRFESVQLGNGNGFNIEGDEVGVVIKWDYKQLGLDLSPDDASVAIAALETGGPWREQSRSANWAGLAIAKVMGLNLEAKGVKSRLKVCLRSGSRMDRSNDMRMKRARGRRNGFCARLWTLTRACTHKSAMSALRAKADISG